MSAFDFSYARPSAQEMIDAGGPNALAYTGAGKPRPQWSYIQSLLVAGVTFTFIQESYSARATEGYWAGVADAQYADAQADGVGYPDDAAIAYCASDGNRSTPGPALAPSIAEYGSGVAAASRRPLLVYGNRVAVDAFRRGAGDKCVGTWVPSSWDAQPGNDVLVQEANITSPIDGTDLNSMYGEWPRWGASIAPLKEDEEMWSALIMGLDGVTVVSYPMNGLAIVGPADDVTGPRGAYGIPQVALDRGPCFRLDTQSAFSGQGSRWDEIQRLNTAPFVTEVQVSVPLTKEQVQQYMADHLS